MTPARSRLLGVSLVVVGGLVTACGGGSDAAETASEATASEATANLSAEAAAGRDIALDRGCAACHGEDGEGTIGPAWAGLFGSERTFQDGTSAVADAEYLRRSIQEPDAERVEGFDLFMPPNTLTDAEITQVIAYIEALQ